MFHSVRFHSHANGAFLLAAAVVGYSRLDSPWWLFFALLLAPDAFMLGYLAGPSVGARIYNIGHSLAWPAALIGWGLLAGTTMPVSFGCIWAAHVGMDHLFGYGYKYPDAFRHTHFDELAGE